MKDKLATDPNKKLAMTKEQTFAVLNESYVVGIIDHTLQELTVNS